MRKLFICTLICSLAALMGCDKSDDEPLIPYVTFTAVQQQTFTLQFGSDADLKAALMDKLEYSVNNGEWKSIPVDDSGCTIIFGGSNGSLRLRGKSSIGTALSTAASTSVSFEEGNATAVACTGDIRTLIDWEKYADADLETGNARFNFLFQHCSVLTSAPALPATTLASYCYQFMFQGCSSLTAAPALPATTLAKSCYQDMFRDCTALTATPELPATTLANYCYSNMFSGCSSLTTAPELLPAKDLVNGCYYGMFSGCTSLETAPALPATTLISECYSYMFRNCASLNSITMLATDFSDPFCMYNWVDGVAASGTFTKAAGVEIETGKSGIPEGWTVKEQE